MAALQATGQGRANAIHWFERKLRQYPAVALDHEKLAANSELLILAVGQDSRRYLRRQATSALGRAIGSMPGEMPGGYVGFLAEPGDFAEALERCLAGT